MKEKRRLLPFPLKKSENRHHAYPRPTLPGRFHTFMTIFPFLKNNVHALRLPVLPINFAKTAILPFLQQTGMNW